MPKNIKKGINQFTNYIKPKICNSLNDNDFDPIIIEAKNETGDLYEVSNKLYDLLNIKLAAILFFLYMLLNSDLFAEHTLSKIFLGTYNKEQDKLTDKGIIIAGIILSLTYLVLDVLDKKNII